MSAPCYAEPPYTRQQRWVALAYGIICHTVFAASVAAMFVSLFSGLTSGFVHLHGWASASWDVFLVAQFAAVHSLLLGGPGRRFLARLAPLGLGKDLSTTTFAGIVSVQLLVTFLFWSPSGTLWIVPDGPWKSACTVLYVISWVLLVKSMNDAGMDVQIGILGWRSVWRNQTPQYQPFTRTGTFRHLRQPIYASFTLILWSAPVWTPDHLAIALLWSGYCVVAPVFKERRYRKFYGEAFVRYQQAVPYALPNLFRSKMTATLPEDTTTDYDVVIVGGGPVGLLLANLLGQRALRVLVVEKRSQPPAHSQAIGITPPSLEILASLGLAEAFVDRGVKIHEVEVHGETGYLGRCSFRDLPGAHPYVLALPQRINVALLEENLKRFPQVEVRRGAAADLDCQAPGRVTLTVAGSSVTANYVVGCDGWKSTIRQQLKIRTQLKTYSCHFLMGDFADESGLGEEAHLFFTAEGAVESFPLPEGGRRWIVQTPAPQPADAPWGPLRDTVQERTGILLQSRDQLNQSVFTPGRMDAEVYFDHRVILCGDAAHAMSPIGGQGMNVGFADAEMLAHALTAIIRNGVPSGPLLQHYQKTRQAAARVAANRAASGMWLGTWRGRPAAWLRDLLMRQILFRPPLVHHLGPRFAMTTLPRCRVAISAPDSMFRT